VNLTHLLRLIAIAVAIALVIIFFSACAVGGDATLPGSGETRAYEVKNDSNTWSLKEVTPWPQPTPTVTESVPVPGPTVTESVPVPGPTVTVTPTPPAPPPGVLSQGSPTRSSGFSFGYDSFKAVDGSTQTGLWRGVAYTNQWLAVDLGAVYNIQRVWLDFRSDTTYAYQFKVEGSNDYATWTLFSDRTSNLALAGTTTLSYSTAKQARYIRVTITRLMTNLTTTPTQASFYPGIWEMQVVGYQLDGTPIAALDLPVVPVSNGLYNVKEFGAVGDGYRDDTQPIEDAMAKCAEDIEADAQALAALLTLPVFLLGT